MAEFLLTEQGKTLYQNLGIDDATQENLNDYFTFREIVDDDRFYSYFRRYIRIYSKQYYQSLRIETMKLDWTVTHYIEHGREVNSSDTSDTSRSKNTVNGGNDTYHTVRTPDLTVENITSDSRTNTDNTTSTNKSASADDSSVSNENVHVNKNAPQSIAYAGTGTGKIPDLDWQYMTGQEQGKDNSITSTKGTVDSNGSSTGNSTSEGDGTSTTTTNGKETSDTTYNRGTTIDNTETESGDSSHEMKEKELSSGRDGNIAEILTKAIDFIYNTNSFLWLVDKLECCFMGVYEL